MQGQGRTREGDRAIRGRSRTFRRRLVTSGALALLLVAILAGTAKATAPVVTTKAATEVWGASANLHGTVNPTSLATTYWFEYGTTTAYGSKTAETSAGSGFLPVEESARITGLTPGSVYHFRILAKNASGTSKGSDAILITPPSAVTKSATEVFAREATLDATVNPEGIKTTYWFEYGTTTSYGTKTSEQTLSGGTTATNVSAILKSLTAGTTYHFRIAMSNAYGTQKGSDQTFTTLSKGWSLQTTPNPEGITNSSLRDVSCVSGSECVAVGRSYGLLSETWNGSAWSLHSMPEVGTSINEVKAVSCSSFSACTAVGLYWDSETTSKTLVERWNGTEWSVQSSVNSAGAKENRLYEVSCTSATFCMAVGIYTDSESKGHPLSETWNGTEWKLQAVPEPVGSSTGNYLNDVSCTASNACTAVGWASGNILAERWNGAEWKVQTTPATEASLEGVDCFSASFCMAVGQTVGGTAAYAGSWNGTEWKSTEAVTPTGTKSIELAAVDCLSTMACYAVGVYSTEAGGGLLSEEWNGTKWQVLPTPRPSGALGTSLQGISCVSEICQAVGSWSAGTGFTLAERYE
jgi:hypothetical protein